MPGTTGPEVRLAEEAMPLCMPMAAKHQTQSQALSCLLLSQPAVNVASSRASSSPTPAWGAQGEEGQNLDSEESKDEGVEKRGKVGEERLKMEV